MLNGKKILAIVTARGGSKGLPKKNIKNLNGKPLIVHTLDKISKSKYVDYTYVSTDSPEIAKVCEDNSYAVPELRPDYLSTDTSSSMDVIQYVIEHLEQDNKIFDYFILLEPTSPLRKDDDIDNIIEIALSHQDSDGVISVGQVHPEHPSILKKVGKEGFIIKYRDDIELTYRRQDEEEALFPYGVGYLIKVEVFKEKHTIYTDKMLPYRIERWQNYEIDDIYDFRCVETIMKEIQE